MNKYKSYMSSKLELVKYLSIITMIIDHVDLLLLDDNIYMRMIGRFSMIGFSYVLAYNYKYNTKNKNQYKKRLFLYGLISQIPYYLAFGLDGGINIMFVLWASLKLIDIIDNINDDSSVIIILKYTFEIILIILVSWLGGYLLFGILVPLLFYYSLTNHSMGKYLVISVGLLNMSYIYIIPGVISLIIIIFLHPKIIITRINKKYYYAFYPVHLLILFVISHYL